MNDVLATDEDGLIRLQKLLAQSGVASRRKCEELMLAGEVEVDGEVVTRLGTKVDPRVAVIRVSGQRLPPISDHVYLVLNKPRGVVSTMSDPEGRRTLTDVLQEVRPSADSSERLFHVGRLDTDTSGLLLLTNDGVLPLEAPGTIAVIGPNATPGRIQGGGSSEVTPHYSVSPLDGLRDRFGDDVVTYARGVGVGLFGPPLDPGLLDDDGFDEAFFATPDLSGEPYRTARSSEASMSFFGAAVPDLGLGSFSARWSTRFTPDQSGEWAFTVAGAGRARVLVDGDVVVDGSGLTISAVHTPGHTSNHMCWALAGNGRCSPAIT